jgi:hypothetical protein
VLQEMFPKGGTLPLPLETKEFFAAGRCDSFLLMPRLSQQYLQIKQKVSGALKKISAPLLYREFCNNAIIA